MLEVTSKKPLGGKLCQGVLRSFAPVAAMLSLAEQAISVKVVEEECPTRMCRRIIRSFNLSMPDRTQMRG